MVRVAVPNKGRLSEATLELFDKAGIAIEIAHDRKLFATAKDRSLDILFVRAQDIPGYVESGVAQLGVTGFDILEETRRDVVPLADLRFGHCRLVLAAPEESAVESVADVPDGTRVATSFPNLTRAWFDRHKKRVEIVEVSGATELTPHIGVAELIVDLTSSGSTLALNGLREVGDILTSTARVVGNKQALADAKSRAAIDGLLAALASVVQARGKRYLMANVPRAKLEEVRRILPGISGPTIMEIAGRTEAEPADWVAAHAVVDESTVARTIADLKRIGATGILVLPIERLVP